MRQCPPSAVMCETGESSDDLVGSSSVNHRARILRHWNLTKLVTNDATDITSYKKSPTTAD